MEDKTKTKPDNKRVPRESLVHQDERLTNKHIQTLGFLKEMAEENKSLKTRVEELETHMAECQDVHDFAKESKEKIKEIQEMYMNRADEINMMLSEKHRMEILQLQDERLETERDMKEQLLKMRQEISGLRDANKDLRETADEEEDNNEMKRKLKQTDANLQDSLTENAELKQQVDCLQEDLDLLQSKKSTDMRQLADLRADMNQLADSLAETQQQKNELEFQLDKARKELHEKDDSQVKLDLIENLRDKIKELSAEREEKAQKEEFMQKELAKLNAKTISLGDMNFELQDEMKKLISEYGHLAIEHEKLRKRSLKDKDKKTFKDFVTLKRELNCIKDENENLKLKTKVKSNSMSMLTDKPTSHPAILPPVPQSLSAKTVSKKKKLQAISSS